MLTPAFDIRQDDDYLYITIRAPHARINETEILFDDNQFKFYSKPYFLRLNLPGKVVENGEETASYDSEKGSFTVKVPKLNHGEHFEGLDMLTKLLEPRGNRRAAPPLIEVIGDERNETDNGEANDDSENQENSGGGGGDGDVDDQEEFDWSIEQKLWLESDEQALCGEKYGFANKLSGILTRLQEDLLDVIDIREPDKKSLQQRRQERLEAETEQFSDDHYLFDLYDQKETIDLIINFETPWNKTEESTDSFEFSDSEKYKMRSLPNKEYLLDKKTKRQLLLSLIDILFAYAYNVRTTEGENTVESGWTICKLSATLSWLETFNALDEVVIACVRRSLCYPLYRNWELSMKILKDTSDILSLGRNYILKCLLEIHSLLNESGDSRYILNDLYITDYCVWVQSVKNSTFVSLATALDKITITKENVSLDLTALEKGAHLAIEESKK